MSGRKTKEITFNIKDRGRAHTGVSRDNVDYKTWIDLINSPATQESIETGSMIGYYGHQLRIMFGLDVPETVIVGGKQISISPAVRTISKTCDSDGNVTHRLEFLDTPEGEFALQKYRAKIGGFSDVNDFKKIDGIIYPTVHFGSDYVLQPNYVTNIGDGVLLDSVHGDIVRSNAEIGLLEMYDAIHSTNHMRMIVEETADLNNQLENSVFELQQKKQQRERLQSIREEKMLDNAICPTMDINEYMEQGKRFMDSVVYGVETTEKDSQLKKISGANLGGFFGGLFG
ncbi:hypothetical protein [Acinetobacter bereziniae]|uniref:hypothetical protein n=1 Tax=Acinetobacter bereziniae TaxID=106648 RepID=UPI0012503393|nr:hypothetical protein [Acinetobacter bereziniae]MCU4320669.1 hypothetical protein [Acinetobacter bereziniae]